MALAELVTLDLGNSSLKLRQWSQGRVELAQQFPHAQRQSLPPLPPAQANLGISVAPKQQARVDAQWPGIHWLKPEELAQIGLVNEAAGAGIDRLATAFGSWLEIRGPLLIADFGTATTFDVISQEGRFLGGWILPGLTTSAQAVAAKAEGLFEVELARPQGLLGKNTQEALQSGIILGNAMMADRLAVKIAQELGSQVTCLLTGGLGRWIFPHSEAFPHWDEDLTHKALARIFREQGRNKPLA